MWPTAANTHHRVGRGSYVALLPVLVLAQGCGEADTGGVVMRRDSAGVHIVESRAPRWAEGQAWTVDPDPVLDLAQTGSGPKHEFFRVRGAIRLRNGSIAVADNGSSEIRVFSPAGEFLAAYGRQGEGPGEFQRLTSVHEVRGDSLLALDYWLRRITVFSLDGSGSRTLDVSPIATRVWKVAPLENGRIVALTYTLEKLVDYGVYRIPYVIVSFTARGEQLDTLARMPGDEGFQFERGDARPLFVKSGFLAVHGNRIYLGWGDSLQINVHRADGRLERIMRVPGYDLRVTREDVEAERAAIMPPPQAPAFTREVVAALPVPETRPAYSGLLVDAAGFVWAPEYHSVPERDLPTDCAVFTAEGEWLGAVRLPARFMAHEFGIDYVLGVEKDELDAEHVLVLRLRRRP